MRVEGLDGLIAAFQSEVIDSPKRAREVVQTYSGKVKESMRANAPVGPTGDLRDQITYETHETKGGAWGEIGTTAVRDGGHAYPMDVEFGTVKMAPEAFAGPSLDEHAGDFEKDVMGVSRL